MFELVDQATSFVMSRLNNWTGTRSENGTASVPTRPELPLEAVQEAIVNAVCHRDYRSNGSVQVMLFRNRLEVWNPFSVPYIRMVILPGRILSGNLNPPLTTPVLSVIEVNSFIRL